MRILGLLLASVLGAGCAAPQPPPPVADGDSVVPGTIGIVVERKPAGVVISAVGKVSPAAAAGLKVGDLVLRYEGVSVADVPQLYRLMLESVPGSRVQVELVRDGILRSFDVPVEQIDTTPRA